ncbi:hypothetical protein ANCDUO_04976 [Ancylostoma duodenale]|uniref:Uncharacterized protein n=1 Tax=Ancylostoma duodenale TaxID=51022 RepID=A0A0C2DPX2_9BILA|nr:hypothetical protein ANCDUO_04976 [Ancylostoma duodenale]
MKSEVQETPDLAREGREKPPAKARTSAKINFCSKVVAIDDVSDEDEDSTEYDEAGNRIVPPSTKRYIYTVFD